MLNIYDIPSSVPVSSLYSLQLNGRDAGCYACAVSAIPFDRIWPGYQRPTDQTEEAAFIYFSSDEPVTFKVTLARPSDEALLRPLSAGVECKPDTDCISFTLTKPGQYTFEPYGCHHALHIFYNPIKDYGVSPDDPDTIYFAPGVHEIPGGQLCPKSGSTIYIAAGAVVYGGLLLKDVENVRILGEGILDNSRNLRGGEELSILPDDVISDKISRSYLGHGTTVRGSNAHNITFDGVIFKDSCEWTCAMLACSHLSFNNIKALGMWRYNSDGIDLCNSTDCSITNSFLRCYDDVIVLKGIKHVDKTNTENIKVSGCVLWCDWGRNLEIGAETCADEIAHVEFSDCDLIHCAHVNMDIQNGDRAYVHDITYENIRVEYSKYTLTPVYQQSDDMIFEYHEGFEAQLFTAYSTHTHYSQDSGFGRISDITVRDICVTADDGMPVPPSILHGYGEENLSERVTFENITFNGERITTLDALNLRLGSFTRDIVIK